MGYQFRFLGHGAVLADGEPVGRFISTKAEALLWYLVVEGGTQQRESLATLLWSEMPTARKNLTKALSNLRQLVGDLLQIERKQVTLTLRPQDTVDLATFDQLVNDQLLQEAIALYHADFLETLSVKDAPNFERWQQEQRAVWQTKLRGVLWQLGESADASLALDSTRRLLILNPYDEATHRRLLRLYMQHDQHDAARQHYEQLRDLLQTEIGTQPEPETQRLFTQLSRIQKPPTHNLPPASGVLFGRKPELTRIHQQLADPTCRLITIVGVGGIGKTHLALHAAHHYRKPQTAFPDGVYFLSLAAMRETAAVVQQMAEIVGVTSSANGKTRHHLVNYLQNKRVLFVLDNCEHLPTVADWIATLLTQTAYVQLIATSRARLRLRDEFLLRLDGLTYAPTTTNLHGGAIGLFAETVRRLNAGFELSADNRAIITAICRVVDGLPLALILAASWSELLAPHEILTHLRRDALGMLAVDMADLPPRHQSMRAIFDRSWQLVTERQRTLFGQLIVFVGEFDIEAATTVTNANLRELMGLVNWSLLTPRNRADANRFVIHPLLRQYARDVAPPDPAAHDRHAAHYLTVVHNHAADFRTANQQRAIAAIDFASDNVQAAWQHAVAQKDVRLLTNALDGLCQFYEWRGRFEEGLAAVMAAREVLSTDAEPLIWQAVFARHLGQTAVALNAVTQALSLAQDNGQRAFAHLQRGLLLREDEREQARSALEESVRVYRKSADKWGTANALEALGWLVQHYGSYREARQLYDESLALRQALGDTRGIAASLRAVGGIALYQGDHAFALAMIEQSVTLHRELSDQIGLTDSLGKLGEILTAIGRYDDATTAFADGQAIAHEYGFKNRNAFFDAMHALALLHNGKIVVATALAEQSLTQFETLGTLRGIAYASLALGWVIAVTDPARAQTLLTRSLTIYETLQQRDELAQAHALLSLVLQQLGETDAAQRHEEKSAEIAYVIGAFTPLAILGARTSPSAFGWRTGTSAFPSANSHKATAPD